MRSKLIFFIVLTYSTLMLSQPAYIYEGGEGSGFYSSEYSSIDPFLYNGTVGSGYTSSKSIAGNAYFYEGGQGDGFTSIVDTYIHFLYAGGDGDGYVSKVDTKVHYVYDGGNGDGYASTLTREPFTWTGVIGQSWTVAGNWNYNFIPGIYRPVIIPLDVPHYPHLNAGLFNIGDNPNNGLFKCASLWIQDGALLVTRINNRIENYGHITIDGTFQVKKQTSDAFTNLEGGLIVIGTGGLFKIKP